MNSAVATDTDEHDSDEDHDHGLSDWGYIKIALLLGVLTGIEVLTYFVDFGAAAVPVLLALMVIKFVIVVAYFMHLKFDNPLFTRVFVGGLLLALCVYAAFLSTMVFWSDPDGSTLKDSLAAFL
jgi:cytochrome c oxidase subunit 4